MTIDYQAHAELHGTAPREQRDGKIAEGTVASMVTLGVDHIAKGYFGVMVLYDDGSILQGQIGEVASRSDFPKA